MEPGAGSRRTGAIRFQLRLRSRKAKAIREGLLEPASEQAGKLKSRVIRSLDQTQLDHTTRVSRRSVEPDPRLLPPSQQFLKHSDGRRLRHTSASPAHESEETDR